MELEDVQSGTIIRARMKGGDAFEVKTGDEGLFLGHMLRDGSFEVHRVERRKMINPMDEKDLFGASGRFTLVDVVDDPFTEAYKRYLDTEYKDTYAEELVRQATTPAPTAVPEGGGPVDTPSAVHG
jgi:hypothetical protein